ncbi:MAG TPA: response regulator [Sphingobium sp.]
MVRESLSILYVDDEEDIRTIVEMALQLDPELTVKVADSGARALAMIGQDGWLPDIALIDVMMPGMTGMELLELLRQRPDAAAIPALFVTASARSTEVQRYIDAGAMGVISKPFDPLTLAGLVRRHYEAWPGAEG